MIKLIALLKRKEGMPREDFAPRWVEEHTKISAKLPGCKGYRINICTPRQPEGSEEEPWFDGTAELWWDSIEDMENSFATPIGVEAGADGDSFTRIRHHLYTQEFIIIPGPEEAKKRTPAKRAVKKTTKKTVRRTTRRRGR